MRLRRAAAGDETFFLRVRNAAATRQASFSGARVAPREHRAWYARSLQDPRARMFVIANAEGRRAGTLRFNRLAPGRVEIHLAILPRWQRRGYALAAAARGFERLRRAPRWNVREIVARIKMKNMASIRFFERLGYQRVRLGRHLGQPCVVMLWRKRS